MTEPDDLDADLDATSLADIDLAAWAAPAAPAQLADAARARALAVDESIALSARRTRKRYALIGGAVAAAFAAGAALWLGVGARTPAREPEPPIVATATDGSRRVDLGPGVAAELERGASVTVRRDGNLVHVRQTGTATWSVAASSQLFIDAGSASITASGASLRVEAPVNLADVKIIGTVTATAAVVALATATVYEGHIKATSGTQTVIVEPQQQVAFKPDALAVTPLAVAVSPAQPPAIDASKGADLTVVPGESFTIYSADGRAELRFATNCHEQLVINFERPVERVATVVAEHEPGDDYTVTLVANRYTYRSVCRGQTPRNGTIDVVLDTCRADGCRAPGRLLAIHEPALGAAFDTGRVHVTGALAPGARLSSAQQVDELGGGDANGTFSADVPAPHRMVALRADGANGAVQYYIQRSLYFAGARGPQPQPEDKARAAECDVENVLLQSFMLRQNKDYHTALMYDSAAYRCAPSVETMLQAIQSACGAHRPDLARSYVLDVRDREDIWMFRQMIGSECEKDGISSYMLFDAMPAPTCGALLLAGNAQQNIGNYAGAVALFEQAQQCRPSQAALIHELTAACMGGDVATARTAWRAAEADDERHRTGLWCETYGIPQAMLDAK